MKNRNLAAWVLAPAAFVIIAGCVPPSVGLPAQLCPNGAAAPVYARVMKCPAHGWDVLDPKAGGTTQQDLPYGAALTDSQGNALTGSAAIEASGHSWMRIWYAVDSKGVARRSRWVQVIGPLFAVSDVAIETDDGYALDQYVRPQA